MFDSADKDSDNAMEGAVCSELLGETIRTSSSNNSLRSAMERASSSRSSLAAMDPVSSSRSSLTAMERASSSRSSLTAMERSSSSRSSLAAMDPVSSSRSSLAAMGRVSSSRPSLADIERSTYQSRVRSSMPSLLQLVPGLGKKSPSRRSSLESAYHSHASDPSRPGSCTPSLLPTGVLDAGDLERVLIRRRNSLSYEAIRAYFLENNPYQDPAALFPQNSCPAECEEHLDEAGNIMFCPLCHHPDQGRRRSSGGGGLLPSNLWTRTSAHSRVVESQFEELLDIPDPRSSRLSSIDLFGGTDIDVERLRLIAAAHDLEQVNSPTDQDP